MSAWGARLALGHLATAAVVGIAGGLGAVDSWWIPVGVAALLAGLVAAALWCRVAPDRTTELSRLAAALNRSAWTGVSPARPAVASET